MVVFPRPGTRLRLGGIVTHARSERRRTGGRWVWVAVAVGLALFAVFVWGGYAQGWT